MAERRNSRPPEPPPQERGLPVNLDAERLILGSIMLDHGLFASAAAKLQPADFSLDKHRRIFTRMQGMHERNVNIDRVSLANELMRYGELEKCDGLGYLVSLDDGLPQIVNLDTYIQIVKDKSVLRKTIMAAQKLQERCMLEDDPAELATTVEEILMGLGESRQDDGPQTLGEVLQGLPGGMQTFLGPREMGLTTGFTRLDEMTSGFHPGQFIIIAARPGAGKSAFALDIARYAALKKGKTVMFFSLEMSKMELLHRATCATARVDSQRVRLNYINSDERIRLGKAAYELGHSKLYVDDKSAATPADLHARIRKQTARGPVDLVIVDYLQLMSAGRNFDNRVQEVSYISRMLKLLAGELKAPVIALSQLNRSPELRKGKPRPQLSDLRESGSLEQDCDLCLMIFREEMYTKDRQDLRGVAEIIISKQRQGPLDTVNLVFLHGLTKFENRAEDMDEPAPLLNTGRGKEQAAGEP